MKTAVAAVRQEEMGGFNEPRFFRMPQTILKRCDNDNDNLFNIHNCYTGTIGQVS
jgi:hypothetical protein